MRRAIQWRALLSLTVAFAAIAAIAAGTLHFVVRPAFLDLERIEIRADMDRARATLNAELMQLDSLLISFSGQDWAEGERIAGGTGPGFAFHWHPIHDDLFERLDINLLQLNAPSGQLLQGHLHHPTEGHVDGGLIQPADHGQPPRQGLVRTRFGLMMVAMRPLAEGGAAQGTTVTVGRLLQGPALDRLRALTQLPLSLAPPADDQPAADGSVAVASLNDGQLEGALVLFDIDGQPVATLTAPFGRHILEKQEAVTDLALLLSLLAGIIVALTTILLLNRQVLEPLKRLTLGISALGRQGSLEQGLPEHRDDEIGQVARAVDGLWRRVGQLAHYDDLTGLPNRALFLDRAAQALRIAKRDDSRIAILFLDLDGFKDVNDTKGHPVGDRLLQAVAARLSDGLRQSDTVARLGGDEFTVLLVGRDCELQAHMVCRKIMAMMDNPFDLGGFEARVGASVGVSLYPEDGQSLDDLLRTADIAMYQAKRSGKGNYIFHGGSPLGRPAGSAAE